MSNSDQNDSIPSIDRQPPDEQIELAIVRSGERAKDNRRTVSIHCGHCEFLLLNVARELSSGSIETVWAECPSYSAGAKWRSRCPTNPTASTSDPSPSIGLSPTIHRQETGQ